ncbi:TPA: hypothetical protein HLT81_24180 [Escherichia coli]|nr:hypothetical protein [Escherichia coli]
MIETLIGLFVLLCKRI